MFRKKHDGPYDCPATGFRERCRKERCPEWVTLHFQHPQTGEKSDQAGCARGFTPILLIKLAQEVRQSAAAIESARNEARKDSAAMAGAIVAVADELKAAAQALARLPGAREIVMDDRRDPMRALDAVAAARFIADNRGRG